MRIPPNFLVLCIVLGIANAIPAFRDWTGFRFGSAAPEYSRDIPWAVQRMPDRRLVVAGQSDDSTCCWLDPVGAFGGSLLQLEATPFVGFPDSSSAAWSPVHQWGYRSGSRVRWFDLQGTKDGGFATVGTIADTILFTGTKRVWRGGQAPDTTDGLEQREILGAGGGGGVGIGIWSDSGMRLRLLRFGTDVQWLMGWQILSGNGGITIAGRFETRVPGQVLEGRDSFPYHASEGTCFAFHLGEEAAAKWWTTLPCAPKLHAEITRTSSALWLTFNDSALDRTIDSSGQPWYRGVRPGLARLDPATGAVQARLHPLGDMQGMVRSVASDETGNLLLQGEQSSAFRGRDGVLPPVLDTLQGPLSITAITAGWLALLDSNGTLRKFRQLVDLENVGGWKIRRAQGIGWIALSWDEHDVLGWSRLYLFDDSLRVIDSTPRLPSAFDVELDSRGEILLTGMSRDSDSAVSWLRGSGSMWVASCRLGSESTGFDREGGAAPLQARVHRGSMEIVGAPGLPIRVRGSDARGRLWLDRVVATGTRLELPRGLSIVVLEQNGQVQKQRSLTP